MSKAIDKVAAAEAALAQKSCGYNLITCLFLAGFIALLMLGSGCTLSQRAPRLLAAPYRPQNVFLWGSGLPPQIRRVAVLPILCDQDISELVYGRDLLDPILQSELAKIRRFELMPVSPDLLRAKTGKPAWSCEDALPPDMFSWLGEGCGSDAVLCWRLTVLRGFGPGAVGWCMRLVD